MKRFSAAHISLSSLLALLLGCSFDADRPQMRSADGAPDGIGGTSATAGDAGGLEAGASSDGPGPGVSGADAESVRPADARLQDTSGADMRVELDVPVPLDGPKPDASPDSFPGAIDAPADLPSSDTDRGPSDAPSQSDVGDAAACPSPAPCALNAKRCGPSAGLLTCIVTDGCPAWSPERTCLGVQRCAGVEPNAACTCPAAPAGCSSGMAGAFCESARLVAYCALDTEGCVDIARRTACDGPPCTGMFPNATCGNCPAAPATCMGSVGPACESASSLVTCGKNAATGCLEITGRTTCTDDGNPCTDTLCTNGACSNVNDDTNTCPGGTCHGGACCTGCWNGSACVPGTSIAACGAGGSACNTCTASACSDPTCNAGTCGQTNDDTNTCPGGTCHAGACCTGCWNGSACLPGMSTAACGAVGKLCGTCSGQQICNEAPSGCWLPGVKLLGTALQDGSVSLAVDVSGNVYVSGITKGAFAGFTNAGDFDIFLTKYDSEGTRLWTRQLGSAGQDMVGSVAIDRRGNVYVSGNTRGGLDGNANFGGADMYLVKFSPSGVKQWTRQWGDIRDDFGYALATDASNNVFVAGASTGNYDGHTNVGGYDMVVTKFDEDGIKQWTRFVASPYDDNTFGVATDSAGNVVLAGFTLNAVGGATNAGAEDLVLAKFDPTGSMSWVRQWGSAADDEFRAVTTDSAGNIYGTGVTKGGLDGNTNPGPGSEDVFLMKVDPSGTKQWTRQFGSATNDGAYGITADATGNLYLTGRTQGGLDGYTNAGDDDVIVAKYRIDGTKGWLRQLGSAARDVGAQVVLDANDGVHVSGYTYGSLDGATPLGDEDAFWLKFNTAGAKQ